MTRTVLVPLDGSAFAEGAMPLAIDLARRSRANLEVVTVHEPPDPVMRMPWAPPQVEEASRRRDAELREETRRYLDGVVQRVLSESPGLGVAATILDGPPAEALAEHADRRGPDALVVMTTHGRGGASKLWLGSVAEGLIRRTSVPVLVVPPRAGEAAALPRAPQRVAVALDETPESQSVIGPATALLGDGATEYTLLHVVRPLHPLLRSSPLQEEREGALAEHRAEAERYLEEVAGRANAAGAHVRTATRVHAHPSVGIADFVGEAGIDLIVLGRRRRGALGRLLLGSVADKVVRSVAVPVLLVPIEPTPGDVGAPARPTPAERKATPADVARYPITLRRVVVAVDFAEPSRRAAHWVAQHLADSELVLVHSVAVPEPSWLDGTSRTAHAELVENARRGAELRLRELGLELGEGRRIWPEVHVAPPVRLIVEMAAAFQADLVVVGEQGEREGRARLLGSTAERVIRSSRSAVLLARGLPDGPPRTLLATIDDSALAAPVVAWTRHLAGRFGANVVLLHVVDNALLGAVKMAAAAAERRRAEEEVLRLAERWLDGWAEPLRAAGVRVERFIGSGETVTEILSAAGRSGAELVVMGRSGAGRLERALLGSTTEGVLRTGEGPVLVVPEPDA